MRRPLAAACVMTLIVVSSSGASAPAEEDEEARVGVPERLAAAFRPPPEFAGDLGAYRSPLVFDDGRPVRDAADWAERRREILATWHGIMGPWPPLIERPRVEVLGTERRERFEQRRVRVEVAPDRTLDGYLLVPEIRGARPAVLVVYYEPETAIGRGKERRDFADRLARRGFVALSLGIDPRAIIPEAGRRGLQPLSYLAYIAAIAYNALARLPEVDPMRVGVMGHSYGGKWALFASCLFEKFACGVWSDPGIVFDESRPNVNYWEPWYLGWEPGRTRTRGVLTAESPRTGAYKRLVEGGHDLHELHALMAPRPFLVSGGSEDPPERWRALNHAVAVNTLLGGEGRVAMTNRAGHDPTEESNEQVDRFLEHVLKPGARPPYPPSARILDVRWDVAARILRRARGSDNWPTTWADDGDLYAGYGDGRGFEPFVPAKLSLGFARIIGTPPDLVGVNVRSAGEQTGDGPMGKKASGLLMVNGRLYLWLFHADRRGGGSQLAWSDDHAKTWSECAWQFAEFGLMSFVNFGRDYAGARDGFVYMVSHDGPRADEPADRMILARAPRDRLDDRSAYEFFERRDARGNAVWTADIARRGANFVHAGKCLRSSMVYCPALGRYLYWQQLPNATIADHGDTRFEGGFGLYDAPEPWGPWTSAYFTGRWDVGPGERAEFPTKWMGADGTTAWLVFSGDDCFSVRRATFTLAD